MQITLTIQVDDEDDIDAGNGMGITATAYDSLCMALSDAGFSIAEGPFKDAAIALD